MALKRAFWCSHVAQLAPFIHFFGGVGGGLLPPLSLLFPPSVETESQSWMEDGLGAALPRAPPHGKAGVALETVARALHHPPLWRGESWQPPPLASQGPAAPGGCAIPWSCDHRGLEPPQSPKFPDLSVGLALRGPCLPLGPRPQLN